MIQSIEATNLKDRTFHYALGELTAIVGPNRSGKTAVLDALRLALLGHIPTLGKTGKATAKLVGTGKVLSVEAVLTTGELYNRSWKKTAAGGLTATATEVPNDEGWPLASLDPTAFLSLGPTDRLRMLATLVGGGEVDPDEIGRLQRELADAGDVGFEIPSSPDAGEHVVGWLAALMREASEVRKGWNQQRDTFRKTLLGLEAVEDPGEIDTTAVEAAEKESREANAKLADARAKYNHLATALQNAPKTDDGPAPDTEATAKECRDARDALEQAQSRQSVENNLRTLREEREDCRERAGADRVRISEECGFESVEDVPATPAPISEEIERLRSEESTSRGEDTALRRQIDTAEKELARLQTKRDEVRNLDACPVCGQAGEDFREDVENHYGELIVGQEAELEKLRAELDRLGSALAETRKELERLGRIAKAREYAARIEREAERIEKLDAEIAQLSAKEFPSDTPTVEEARRRVDAATQAHARETERDRKLRESGAAATVRQSDVDAALEAYNDAEQSVMEADAKLEQHREAVESLSERRRKAREREKIEAQIDESEKFAKALDGAVSGLQSEQSRIIRDLTVPILQAAEVFAIGVIDGKFAISEDLDLVIDRPDGHRVSFDALSGAERLIATSALQVALGAASPLRVAVLDEFSVIGGEARTAFLGNLNRALSDGIVDQVILTDWDEDFWRHSMPPEEVTLIETS